jgi:hypothetical protein
VTGPDLNRRPSASQTLVQTRMKVKIENRWDFMRGTVRVRRRGLLRPVPAQRFFLVRFSFHIFFPFCFTSNKPNVKVLIRLDAHAEITVTNHKMLLWTRPSYRVCSSVTLASMCPQLLSKLCFEFLILRKVLLQIWTRSVL